MATSSHLNTRTSVRKAAGAVACADHTPWCRRGIIAIFSAFTFVLFPLFAKADTTVTATLEPAEIRPGAFATYTITIQNGVPDAIPQLKVPQGLSLTTVKPAYGQQIYSDGNGTRQASTLTWQFNCNDIGEYVIPKVGVRVRGQVFDTEELRLVVKENPAFPVSKFDPLMTLEVEKREFYVGEVIPVTVNLYVHRSTYLRRVGLIEMPKESFAVQRFPLQGDESTISMGGVQYRSFAFHSTLSGLKPGKFALGPATSEIIIEVPSNEGRGQIPLFSQSEPRKVRPTCNDVEVTVLPLPTEGQPKDFKNLVGDFQISMAAEPREVMLNDPISVELTISGTGNFDAVTVPAITDPASWKIYPPRRFNVQSSDNTADGAPRSIGFSQVIIPKKKVDAIPSFELSFFSPLKKQYVTLRTQPIPIKLNMPEQSVEPPPASAGAVAVGKDGRASSDPDKVPKAKPIITDILAVVPQSPQLLTVRTPLWADQRFRMANILAVGALSLLILGKFGAAAWRTYANSPLAPTRHLWSQLRAPKLSRARFYDLAASYISARGLAGEPVDAILRRHHEVNYGRPTPAADEPVPPEERSQVLEALHP